MRAPRFLHAGGKPFCLALVMFALVLPLRGDDGAASVGAGGLVLRKETRISMEKERLVIGMRKITVDFDFLNESDQNISTEVAFPIPTYSASSMLGMESLPNFADFKVWINGKELKYQTELKANVRGKDYSGLLQKMGINLETFGDFEVYDGATKKPDQISGLTAAQRSQLVAAGLLEHSVGESYVPHWSVSKTYYWKQEFPAHQIVRIRHEYTPVVGAAEIPVENFDPKARASAMRSSKPGSSAYDVASATADMMRQGCVDQALQKRLEVGTPSGFIFVDYVNYILTSANTWKTPIKDFELVVDHTGPSPDDQANAAFCWDGQVHVIDATHLSAKATNFVPKRELVVYFFRR